MNTPVVLENVKKKYGKVEALKGLSLKIETGEIVTLLGPNGAGKSTTIGILLGLVSPTSGSAKVFGKPPIKTHTRKDVGSTPQDSHYPENSKVGEILSVVSNHYENAQSLKDISERFMISHLLDRRTDKLSGGQRRCLSLACAFVGNPKLIILDEPTVGLDVDVRKKLWQEIINYKKEGGTILLTTHYLEEAESVSDRIAVVNRGTLIRQGTPQEIKRSFGRSSVVFGCRSELNFPNGVSVRKNGDLYTVTTGESDKFVKEFLRDKDFFDLEIHPMSLEEAFLEILKE